MTREEAIRIIETVFQDEYVYKYYDSITHQALNMAIEALKAREMREYIVQYERKEADNPKDKCDLCNHAIVGELVRCKDCKHWYADADTGMACEFTNMGQPEDGYCNWGERKGGDDE